eukprot:5693057-Prymnesium_polylepis.1
MQPIGHRDAILLLPLHAQAHRLEAAQAQPAVVRRQPAALRVLLKVDLVGELLPADGEDARRHVGVPRDKLGRGRHADVGAERERLLEDGCHHRVVDHRQRAPRTRDGGDARNVDHLHPGVGGRLHPDEL